MPSISFAELTSLGKGEPSSAVRERVVKARKIQQERFAGQSDLFCNADMRPKEMRTHGKMDEETHEFLKQAISELNFSARAYDRILKVARTIADLAGREELNLADVSEAIQYRNLDRQLWV